MRLRTESGAATVEHAGLSVLVALLIVGAIAGIASRPSEAGRELGSTLARKLRCATVGPGPCWRDPLTEAYGRALAGAVRALAPAPVTRASPSHGRLLPVDFRRCRSPGCAAPGSRSPALTASNRRTTAFAAVTDRRADTGTVTIDYWLYRPTLQWEGVRREVDGDEIARLAPTPLLDEAVPVVVALETLPGANQYDFAPAEEPPWRWQIERR